MASFSLNASGTFTDGTSVGAYLRSQWGVEGLTGAPTGGAVASGTVSGGTVAFTGLADSTEYIAYASSPNRYERFRTSAGPTSDSGQELGYAEITSNSFLTGTTRGPGSNPLTLSGVVVGSRPILVVFSAAALQVSADQGIGILYFSRSPAGAGTWTDIGYLHGLVSATTGRVPAHRELRQSLAAGSYDFKVEMITGNAAHTVTIPASGEGSGQPGPASLSVLER